MTSQTPLPPDLDQLVREHLASGRFHSESEVLRAALQLLGELDNPATTLELTPLDLGVVLALQDIARHDVPDLPDRVIAATALHHGVPLVTCDGRIRNCGVTTIW